MNFAALVERLELNAPALAAVFRSVTSEQAAWRPAPGAWSILEVACHLLDEEREDFPARLRLLLEDGAATWPSIDPPGWVEERAYAERQLDSVVVDFLSERARSIAWLRSLVSPDWNRVYDHPQLGPLKAGDLLVAWASHDALHLRQLARIDWAWVCRHGEPFTPNYAGEW